MHLKRTHESGSVANGIEYHITKQQQQQQQQQQKQQQQNSNFEDNAFL